MIIWLDRHLKNRGYYCIAVSFYWRIITLSNQVLDGKAKQLPLVGCGKCPNKAQQVSEEEEETQNLKS